MYADDTAKHGAKPMKTISSQRHLDDEIVEQKIADADFDVLVSPEFDYDGDVYRIVIDGHHSLAAARIAGNDPNFIEATIQQSDSIGVLRDGNIDDYLQINRIDSAYYDIDTGKDVW